MPPKAIAEMLLPTFFSYFADDCEEMRLQACSATGSITVSFTSKLPDLEITKDGKVFICAWELDLHNPKYASLLKARVTRCNNDLNCKCKYRDFEWDDEEE